jgi:hypothetical protein
VLVCVERPLSSLSMMHLPAWWMLFAIGQLLQNVVPILPSFEHCRGTRSNST